MKKKEKTTMVVSLGLLFAVSALFLGGCSRGSGSETIKIGAIYPITGNYSYEAQSLVNVQQMAVDEINAAGGIAALGGKKLELVVGDSQGAANIGASEAQRLIQEGVAVLTGTYQSGVTATATQEAEREDVPFVVTISNNVAIFERGFKYSFRIQPNANIFAENFIDYIGKVRPENVKTAVIIHEDSVTGTDSSEIIEKNIGTTGLTLLANISYSLSATSLSAEVTRIVQLAPDMLITIGYFSDTSMLVKELNERGVTFKMVCGVANGGISEPKFLADFGDSVENYLNLNYYYNPNSERSRKVLDDYKKRFGSDMSIHAIFGYESIYVIADALQRKGSADRKALRDALAETNKADHVLPFSGPIKFDEKGENINASTVLIQIQNGKHALVYPEEFSEAPIKGLN